MIVFVKVRENLLLSQDATLFPLYLDVAMFLSPFSPLVYDVLSSKHSRLGASADVTCSCVQSLGVRKELGVLIPFRLYLGKYPEASKVRILDLRPIIPLLFAIESLLFLPCAFRSKPHPSFLLCRLDVAERSFLWVLIALGRS